MSAGPPQLVPLEVIVPIYGAAEALAACLRSLDRTCAADQPILLIDDASPDPTVRSLLACFADRPSRRVIHHGRNRGFVETANEGFAATGGDVVLLNSDTIVTRGWLSALARALALDARIATATPFSNNAEICSLPHFCRPSPVPGDPEAIAAAIARSGPPVYPELPTAVGFCMAIRRAALDAVGSFDAETFGAGYGEENDFCMRASAAGFRHVLCDDAYVAHVGQASFGATPHRPGGEAMRRLLAKHPAYEAIVHAFIAADPIAPRRAAVLAALEAPEAEGSVAGKA